MAGLNDMHDDEVKARLGMDIGLEALPLVGLEDRIIANALRAFPEPFDPETDAELEALDLTRGTAQPEGQRAFRERRGNDELLEGQ